MCRGHRWWSEGSPEWPRAAPEVAAHHGGGPASPSCLCGQARDVARRQLSTSHHPFKVVRAPGPLPCSMPAECMHGCMHGCPCELVQLQSGAAHLRLTWVCNCRGHTSAGTTATTSQRAVHLQRLLARGAAAAQPQPRPGSQRCCTRASQLRHPSSTSESGTPPAMHRHD